MTRLLPTIAARPGRRGLMLVAIVLSAALLGIPHHGWPHVVLAALPLKPKPELSKALLTASPVAPPTCTNPTAALTSDYTYAVGSAGFSDPDGDPENGNTFRWLADGSPATAGPVAEGLLLHFDGTTTGANGEVSLSATGVGYATGRFGQALALANPGVLTYPRPNNLTLDEGTWELWLAPQAAGDDPIYADPNRWHVLLHYEAANGDDLFIKDVNGNPIEVWPGSYRINLTKFAVAEYQACSAYQSWVASGYQADSVFFDNVMTSQSWLTRDIYGNPVQIDADEDGVADDPAALDVAWKAGVFHEMETFRRLMPHAIVSSHSTDIHEPGISGLFNGISIGFRTANVLEGEESFPEVFDDYRNWLQLAKSPPTTMIESSPLDDIAYGCDYDPLSKIPASTLEFACTYAPWMRFGLAFTLMDDGYFAHEFGNTHHGNDWWYDELDCDLGYPLGPADRVPVAGFDPGPNQIVNPGFEQPIAWPWNLWADTGSGCAATLARDTAASAPEGSAAARVDVTATCGEDWRIELAQHDRSLSQGTVYDVTFWARSTVTCTLIISSQQGRAPWTWYGLWRTVEVGPTWRAYTVSFEANATVNDARIQFFLGNATGTVWLDDVRLTLHPPDVFRRDFDRGIVLLNGTRQSQTVELGPGFRRLVGNQAPRYETILDDAGPGFSVISGDWQPTGYDSGEWKASGPFYHDWGVGLRQLSSSAGAVRWDLPIGATDMYTVSAWWPAASEATGWNAAAQYKVVANGVVVASATLDQHTGGDRWHNIVAVPLAAGDAAFVRLTCSGAPCVADALHIRSVGRYNDGSPAASVTLAPLDGIVLARVAAAPPDSYLPLIIADAAELH